MHSIFDRIAMTAPTHTDTMPHSVLCLLARDICARHDDRPDALIEILHRLQEACGHVPKAAMPVIADALNLSRAEVHGVVSFYHDFRSEKAGTAHIRLCRAEACQAVGSEQLATYAEQRLGVTTGKTRADGAVTLEAVYCLGNCALGPAALIDGQMRGRVDREIIDAIAANLAGCER